MKNIVWILAIAAVAIPRAASAQDTQDPKNAVYVKKLLADAEILGAKGGFMGAVIKNAPYTGEEISESNQMLADGTRIHNETRASVYRDAEGRVRRETPDAVTIWDPVQNASFFLNLKDQTYRQMPLAVQFLDVSSKDGNSRVAVRVGGGVIGAPGVAIAAPPPPPGGGIATQMFIRSAKIGGPEQVESLGRQNMEGLPADGTRQTSTIEAGAIGNDRPIQITSERWYSPDLQIAVMTRHNDPRTGEESFRLVNITRGDQPANLFAVPPGYQKLEGK